MQRLAISAAILAATWTAPALAGWYSFGDSAAAHCGCGHGFAHQLHCMTPEQLWAGYCQQKASRRGCGHGLGCGCGAACGHGACGGAACGYGTCGCGPLGCGARGGWGPACGAGQHGCGLPAPSACSEDDCNCSAGCSGPETAPSDTAAPPMEQTDVAEYGDGERPDLDAVQTAE